MKRIFIAEDDIVTRTLISEQVKSFGYAVTSFEDGISVFEALSNNPEGADLLITDVRMPGMDGIELIARLRKMEQFSGFPIIIMSGVVGVKDISELLKNGASRFLAKPIDPDDLSENIRKALSVPHFV
ncbi:response regulator [Desulfovibrio subterraneus]|jgi:CheY-like chemotaxis protein|uniref:Response regulator n=1 Tax=Desulfovibrio subterraneus TaxID=2718620 RepID=A0A7J0BNC4_9BACT|nr:response regulator [Desulfovibrio subterraneus]WBF66582.1 response regulator [Desulfovibrio subterraneus]GFM34702.1 response regulator [Desulfovibrio subterraneus]